MNETPDYNERLSRDTRPQPARRNAAPSKAAQLLFLAGRESDLAKLSRGEHVLLVLTGPWMILPWLIVLTFLTTPLAAVLPAEVFGRPERLLFFQGSDDWGGSMMFALTASALAFFAVTIPLHLSLRLRAFVRPAGFARRLGRALLAAAPFVVVFLWLLVNDLIWRYKEGYSEWHVPVAGDLDLLALLLVAATVCAAGLVWVAALDGSRLSPRARFWLAPLFALVWFVLASDGQTPRAGQMIQSGWEPLPAVRGARHAAMLAWRRAVLAPFGYRVRRMPEDSPLWFWTDGFVYFQTAPRPSRTARALRPVEPPPWAAGKPAWGLPVAAEDATPVHELFPYSFYGRHFGGYFFRTPEGPVHLVGGRIEPPRFWVRDIHLADGAPYLAAQVAADGTLRAERRTVDFDAWRRMRLDNREVAPEPEAPYEPSLADAALPVQLFPDPDATFASFTNAVLRLRAAGFENLFIETLPH
jgi:hypothetical protein